MPPISLIRKLLVLLGICFVMLYCQKWDFDRVDFLLVLTSGATPQITTATLAGQIQNLRSGRVEEYGFLLSESKTNPLFGETEVERIRVGDNLESDLFFIANLSNLKSNTAFFYRAYVLYEEQTLYGDVDTFRTNQIILSIEQNECLGSGLVEITATITGLGPGIEIADYGIVWSENNTLPVLESDATISSSSAIDNGNFSVEFPTEDNRVYFLRPFIQVLNDEPVYSIEVISFSTIEGGKWVDREIFPGEDRINAVAFAIEDKGYLGFGQKAPFDNCEIALSDFWQYDLNTGWESIDIDLSSDAVAARSMAVGFALGNKGYLGWGCSCGGLLRDFYEFDPKVNSWKELTGPSFDGRILATSFVIEDKAFIGGGGTIGCLPIMCELLSCTIIEPSDIFRYDANSSSWQSESIWNKGFAYNSRPTSFGIGNKAYLGLEGQVSRDFYEFDPEKGWEVITAFPGQGRFDAIALVLHGKAYVSLGEKNGIPLNDLYEFDPNSNEMWRKVSGPPESTSYNLALSIKNRGIVVQLSNGLTSEYVPELCP